MNHGSIYVLKCYHCGHEIHHSAESVPGGIYVLTCPECNHINSFRCADEGKYSNPKSRKLEDEIVQIFLDQRPRMTVRQVFYALTVKHAVPKSEPGYRQAQYALKKMRVNGQLPFGWIADNTRWQIKPKTYTGMAAALYNTQELYRRNLWEESPYHVEIWVEKDALAGVISPVTQEYDVPLYVARGNASMTFIYEAAEEIKEIGKEAYVYHFGDFDKAGVTAAQNIRDELRKHGADIHFERMAVTEEQISSFGLATRPPKEKDTKSWWGNTPCTELDAIPAPILRDLVRGCIEQHIDQSELKRLREIEEQERVTLRAIANNFVLEQKSSES
jgi:hypothetical protein